MNRDLPTACRDQKEKQNFFDEVVNAERQLWVSIQSKGILHPDVQDLYHKVRTAYENIVLNANEVMKLQDVEFFLWKLHYKHIDEFRRRIKKSPIRTDSTKSGSQQDVPNVNKDITTHLEGFKLFLYEAIEFYKNLISKLKRCYGLPEGSFLNKKDESSIGVEPVTLQRCKYVWHRFLVCLGDLSRYYKELWKNPEPQKWGVAATYYFEATLICPDSGNPQNQLALLSTYIGDDLLALYHCIRSLAVKEPFPDARDNILLVFEQNRSCQLHSLSSEASFDFSKPLKRSSSQAKSHSSSDSTSSDKLEAMMSGSHGKTELWSLFVRMISFFLVNSSLEDFPQTFASTMMEFETLLALDDTQLESSLEPYEKLDWARKGPYRVLQVVSILIFIIHNLADNPEAKSPNGKHELQRSSLAQWGWTCSYTILGHFIERCLIGNNHLEHSPLLPAVLVFVEWFVGMLEYAEAYDANEKVSTARSYFVGAIVELLNRLDFMEDKVKSLDQTALWEDYELRGFGPIAHSHESLDFSAYWSKYDEGSQSRTHRIFLAAMKMVNRPNVHKKWIFYDQLERKFYSPDSDNGVKGNYHSLKHGSSGVEEEEEIVFKPLIRHNSAPVHTSTTSDQTSVEGISRSTSLFVEQNEDIFSFHSDNPDFRYKQKEPVLAGPPSLNAWVLNRESSNMDREKLTRNISFNPELSPVQEVPYSPLANTTITKDTVSSSPYVAPVPSAPSLPEDPKWLRGNFPSFPENKIIPPLVVTEGGHGILGASPHSRFSNLSPPHELIGSGIIPGVIEAFPQPPVFGMSSSEWLYRYNLERGNITNHAPGGLANYLHGYDSSSRFDFYDRLGNPLATNRAVYMENPNLYMGSPVYGGDEHRREKLFPGLQRLNHNGCGIGASAEQPQLLQYLKEREWQLQNESPMGGHAYMGN